jgi:predicted TIM-barrel fold metal-dependent hydrolase
VIIDFHTHVGDLRHSLNDGHIPVTWENLIARLDDEGIDKAVVLPSVASPEAQSGPGTIFGAETSLREQVLAAKRYSDRIVCFGNMDPRWMGNSPKADFDQVLRWFLESGCRGVGEIVANMPFDDPRTVNMFRQIGDAGWPVDIHGVGFLPGTYGLQDDPGAPRLESLLRQAPKCVICGHGQGFWAEMGADLTMEEKMGYPKGPIIEEGALPRLFRDYGNLYGDISAGSGFNALTRDPEYGLRFLHEFQDRLLFGTDVCFAGPDDRMPHLGWLQGLLAEAQISRALFEKVTWRNAERLLGAV